MILYPFFISFITGFLLINLLLTGENRPGLWFRLILGAGLGLGLSSHLTFYGFLLFNRLCPEFTINAHLVLLAGLSTHRFFFIKKKMVFPAMPRLDWKTIVIAASFLAALTLVIKSALFYPYGGWDAWQVWNFKAKFLFLAGDHWQDLFDPKLWRTSPHYPLLLPLMNVWAWLFTQKPIDRVPLIISVIFTMLTAGLLSAALWQRTKNYFSILAGLLILTLPFFNLLATSQYCDIVLSFYLLAVLITLAESFTTQKDFHALLSGLFCGFLGFTKPEGLIAVLLIGGLAAMVWAWGKIRNLKIFPSANFSLFLLGLAIASIPTFAFQVLYSPGNQTFINGLTSTVKPATGLRLQTILYFLWLELRGSNWSIWLLILLGIILGGKRLWIGKNVLFIVFLLLYLSVILAYYELNTYFEIRWWLSVSLNRILFSLIPLALLWVFGGILADEKKGRGNS